MTVLFNHDQLPIRGHRQHVHPIHAFDHVKVVPLAGARGDFFIRTHREDAEIPDRLGAEFLPGPNHHLDSSQFTVLAGTILMLSMATRVSGLLASPFALGTTGVSPSLPRTSSPLISLPKAVYCPSSCGVGPRQMKNWEPAESGSAERDIEMTPRTCLRALNSALIL